MLIVIVLLVVILSTPIVQTKLAKIVTDRVNEKLGTSILVKKVDLSLLGNINLKGIEIRDHHKDTLIFVKNLKTSLINAKKIVDNKVNLDDIHLEGVDFYLKTYKGEKTDNLSVFIEAVEGEESTDSISTPFILKAKNIYLSETNFKLIDDNDKNNVKLAVTNAGSTVQDFSIIGSDFSMKIRGLHGLYDDKIQVTNLSTNFSYTKKEMLLEKTLLKTINKTSLTGNIKLNYSIEDFSNFNDKVKINAVFRRSRLAIKDLKQFYNELSSNDLLYFSTKFKGTLNDFSLDNLNLISRKRLRIKGDLDFVNSFNTARGFIFRADIKKVASDYDQLKRVLPNVLGKNIPSEFKKLGSFSISGLMELTSEQMEATLQIDSEIGKTSSNLQLTNISDIDNAKYKGIVSFKDFDFGKFLNDKNLGKASLKADVLGSGFTAENVNTVIIGKISKLNFKGYTYKNLDVNGLFENKKFDGILISKDENFDMQFEGLADFSSKVYKFDFYADITKIDLNKTNLFTRDSIAEISGAINLDIKGNTIDNIVGKAVFKDITYVNQKQKYPFKEFEVNSFVKDSVRNIKINSKEIVEGEVEGKFTFTELLPMTQNALGSIYTYYEPYKIKENQYINFNFTIYNQIIDIFFPEVSIDKKTLISGKIRSNDNYLKLKFSSPQIIAYKNKFENIVLRMDNKQELYNAHLTTDKIENKKYTISNLNLINRTENDTLFFKSAFDGGKKQSENYILDFYYTINKDKKSVVGVQKSIVKVKGNTWFINPEDDLNNKVTFDLKEDEYEISPFKIESNNQKIDFSGKFLEKKKYKSFKANFEEVKLQDILPDIEDLQLEGLLNGKINYHQEENKIKPESNIAIQDFTINNINQGDLKLKVAGRNSYKMYDMALLLENHKGTSLSALGKLDFSEKDPTTDLKIMFKDYSLEPYKNIGGEVISNLRGKISGNFTAKGPLLNPDFNGYLSLHDVGLTFPYLNIDFNINDKTKIKLKEQSFIIDNIVLNDTKYQTKANISGSVTHQNFTKWFMNLSLDTNNLLVLDTKEEEDSQYYGTGFLKGSARITGLTNNLTIDVNGSTNPGTIFVIPLNDVTTVNNYNLIHFKSEENKRKQNLEIGKVEGLNLNINLAVTDDAVAQVVIDKVSGSDLKGTGTGNLLIEINTRGKFNMYGDFVVKRGVYNFRYGGIITRPFTVQQGGSISWSGNPLGAELDLVAVYQTKANPSRLLDNVVTSRKVPVDLFTKITGGLFSSKQEFDIKMPNVSSLIASELEFKINDNDQSKKMRQFFSLLVTGSFFNEEGFGVNAVSLGSNTASDLVSGILSDLINTKDGKFQLGVGYTQGNKNELTNVNSDNQVDVSVSTKLSDRVIVNGKVGVPVGTNTQTSVVGEVKLEVLLNEKGNLRGTVFNRQNEVQYSEGDEGYTQGVGFSYQVNFNNFNDLMQKIGVKKEKRKKIIKKDTINKNQRKLINFKKVN